MSLARAFFALAFLFHLCMPCYAQYYRSSMDTPSYKVLGMMSMYAERGELDKISGLIPSLKAVLSEIKEKFEVDMNKELTAALGGGKSQDVLKAIRKTTYYDIKALMLVMKEGEEKPAEEIRKLLDMAQLDYHLLSPVVRGRNFKTNEEIKLGFMKGFAILKVNPSVFSTDKSMREVNLDALRNVLDETGKKIKSVFPDFEK